MSRESYIFYKKGDAYVSITIIGAIEDVNDIPITFEENGDKVEARVKLAELYKVIFQRPFLHFVFFFKLWHGAWGINSASTTF